MTDGYLSGYQCLSSDRFYAFCEVQYSSLEQKISKSNKKYFEIYLSLQHTVKLILERTSMMR